MPRPRKRYPAERAPGGFGAGDVNRRVRRVPLGYSDENPNKVRANAKDKPITLPGGKIYYKGKLTDELD